MSSLGFTDFDFETLPNVQEIMVLIEIVPVNVPAHLGLHILNAECLYEDKNTNRVVRRKVHSRYCEETQCEDT